MQSLPLFPGSVFAFGPNCASIKLMALSILAVSALALAGGQSQLGSVAEISRSVGQSGVFDGAGKSFRTGGRPLRFEGKSAILSNFSVDGEIWLGTGTYSLVGVKARGIRLSRVSATRIEGCQLELPGGSRGMEPGQGVGIWIIGSSNVTIRDCTLTGFRIGIEAMPGHPWTFRDEAKVRGIESWWKDGDQFVGGVNINGGLESRNKPLTVTGNGTNTVVFKLQTGEATDFGRVPYKLDYLPLTQNAWFATRMRDVRCIAEKGNDVTLMSPEVWQRGKTYHLYTYNPKFEMRNLQVLGCRFSDCRVAGVSLYYASGFTVSDNVVTGTTDDYAIGFEQCRNGLVERNRPGSRDSDQRMTIGMIGHQFHHVFSDNGLKLSMQANWRPFVDVVNRTGTIDYLQKSPWQEPGAVPMGGY